MIEKGPPPLVVESTAASKDSSVEQDASMILEERNEYLTGLKLLSTMVAITLVGFLMLLDSSIVSTAIPKITSDFQSLDDVGWYGTAYFVSNCALQPLTGKMYTYWDNKASPSSIRGAAGYKCVGADQWSPQWTFLSFFAVFELGSVVCGAATSSKMLVVGRAIAGMGASGLLNGGYTIVYTSVAPKRQTGNALPTSMGCTFVDYGLTALLGILLGVAQFGLLGGPLIGGALTEFASWRWCFYINLPCGVVVALCLVFLALPDNSARSATNWTVLETLGKLDLTGFALFAGSSIQVLLALNWGGSRYLWNSATIIGLFSGSGVSLLVFLAWEYYMEDKAMIPFSLVRRRTIWSSCLNYAFFAGWLLSSTYYLPIYFQAVRNASPTMSGVDLLPSVVGNMLFAGVTGALVGRIGYYLPFGVASGVLSIIGSGLLTTLTPTISTAKWIGYQIIQGVGGGFGIQIPVIAVQHCATKEEVSIATALVVFSQQFGGAVFLSLGQVIFGTSLREKLALYAPDVETGAVTIAGATGVRDAVPPTSLSGVLLAYTDSVDHVLYLTTGAAGGALLFAFGMGWVNIKPKAVAGTTLEEQGASSSSTAVSQP